MKRLEHLHRERKSRSSALYIKKILLPGGRRIFIQHVPLIIVLLRFEVSLRMVA